MRVGSACVGDENQGEEGNDGKNEHEQTELDTIDIYSKAASAF